MEADMASMRVVVIVGWTRDGERLPVQCGEVVSPRPDDVTRTHYSLDYYPGDHHRHITVDVSSGMVAHIIRDEIDYGGEGLMWDIDGNIRPWEDLDVQDLAVNAALSWAYPREYSDWCREQSEIEPQSHDGCPDLIGTVQRITERERN